MAAYKGHESVAQVLLDRGADTTIVSVRHSPAIECHNVIHLFSIVCQYYRDAAVAELSRIQTLRRMGWVTEHQHKLQKHHD